MSRSLRAIRRADVCLVMIDGVEGVAEQDKRVLGYCRDQGTAMVLVWTKWDLVEDRAARFKELSEDLDFKAPYLKYVPSVTISNLTRQRLFKAFDYVDRVAAAANLRIGTGELNRFAEDVIASGPTPRRKGKEGKVRYITQASVKPTVFVLFVNDTELFHFSYVRYLENKLRERFGFEGVPIKIEVRGGSGKRK